MTLFLVPVEFVALSGIRRDMTILALYVAIFSVPSSLLWSAEGQKSANSQDQSRGKACKVLADKRIEEPLRTIAKEYAFRTGSQVSLRFLPGAEVDALVQKKKTECDVVLDIGKKKGSKSPVGELPGAKPVAWKHPTGEPVWAALLTDQPIRLDEVPDLSDIRNLCKLLGELGCACDRENGSLRLHTTDT